MNIIEKITRRTKRRPSTQAQLIALPKAVLIYTEEGSVIVTPQLAKDIQANLAEITRQAEDYKPENKTTVERTECPECCSPLPEHFAGCSKFNEKITTG